MYVRCFEETREAVMLLCLGFSCLLGTPSVYLLCSACAGIWTAEGTGQNTVDPRARHALRGAPLRGGRERHLLDEVVGLAGPVQERSEVQRRQ